jgi:hypothetical protein
MKRRDQYDVVTNGKPRKKLCSATDLFVMNRNAWAYWTEIEEDY